MLFHTISADNVPVAILTAVALKSDHVTVARALTSDVTLGYDVITDTAKTEAVARCKQYTQKLTLYRDDQLACLFIYCGNSKISQHILHANAISKENRGEFSVQTLRVDCTAE